MTRVLPIDNSELENLRQSHQEAVQRVNELDKYSSREELEKDLQYLQSYNTKSDDNFAYIFTSCTDKRILIDYYEILKKYDVHGANEITEDLIEEVKWEIKKLKVFDGLGD